jgi:hypothetical protein
VELGAVDEVPFERLLQLPGEPLVVEHRVQLITDAEAADVDVAEPIEQIAESMLIVLACR